MLVETVRSNGPGIWVAGLVGRQSERFRFVKRQSVRAAAQGDEPRARAVGFLMALYQRRLASSTHALRRSLENRARRLTEGLKRAHDLLRTAPPDLPDQEEMDELEDAERERLEQVLEAITLAGNEAQVRDEIAELRELAAEAKAVEGSGSEAKLAHLRTIEGRVLKRLLHKLQEIRDALDDDAVFNVVGEVLPSAHVERVLRDYYAGKLGDADLEDRLLKDVDEGHFRSICQTALEGLAAKKLNLDMLIERRARAQERRVVPETIARFITECAQDAALALKPVSGLAHTFDPGRIPPRLKKYEREPGWITEPMPSVEAPASVRWRTSRRLGSTSTAPAS